MDTLTAPTPAPSTTDDSETLVSRIWASHRVSDLGNGVALLHVDRQLLHERSGGRMLAGVLEASRKVFDANSVFATIDHIIDTDPGRTDHTKFPGGEEFIRFFRENAAKAGVEIFDIDDPRQGIVHVMAPELGIALPGMTLVCGDSHTSTMGGIGALAWGIGITQGEHALATQCLPVTRPKDMLVRLEGTLPDMVSAKDVILALIGREGANGGKGYAVEFAGSAARAMSPAQRMTLCNMAVEFGAWTGIVAPDDQVFDYLYGRPYAPKGHQWEAAVRQWRQLRSGGDAAYSKEIVLDASRLRPQVTWGTSGEHVIDVDGRVPDPALVTSPLQKASMMKALEYMELAPGTCLQDVKIEAAFIGSCTNSRLEDLRSAARLLKGRKVAPGVRAICVPGSTAVKHEAEAEGIDTVFRNAGFEWREAGCSLCFYAGGDSFGDARRVISTTNRNFQNRQGPGVKTHLASPVTVVASAIAGRIADPARI